MASLLRPRRFILAFLLASSAISGGSAATSLAGIVQRTPVRFFSPSSFWNKPLANHAPLDRHSAGMASGLRAVVRAEERVGSAPWINATYDGLAIVTVGPGQPTVRVHLNHAPDAALAAAWKAVPLPASAHPSGGEGDLVVVQPSTDRMWEFWHLIHQRRGWYARWGGAMEHVSTDQGAYGPAAWSGAENWWGVTAASLPIVGGVMTSDDLASGHIDHALAMAVPNVRAGFYASPAKRDDGDSKDPRSLPEGAHLRLDPSLNLAKLRMPPLTRMMAEAAQRYGIIVRDYSGLVAFYAQDPVGTGSNVLERMYRGTYPSRLLASFPWSHLEVLKMQLHRGH